MGGSCNSAGTVALQCGTVLSYLLLTVGDKGIKCPSRSPGQHRGGPLGAPPFATMAAACHRMPQAARCLATCPRGKPRSDAWRASWSAVLRWRSCRGKWLAAGVVFLCLIACQLSGLAGALGAPRRASLVVPGFGLPDKLLLSGARSSVSYTLFLDGLTWAQSSRQAPLAGVLSSWPGKLLLPGALSSWPGKLLLPGGLFLNAWSSLGASWVGLAAGCYNCPYTSLGY